MAEAEYSEIGPLDEVNEVNLDESIQQHQRTTAIYDDVQDLWEYSHYDLRLKSLKCEFVRERLPKKYLEYNLLLNT